MSKESGINLTNGAGPSHATTTTSSESETDSSSTSSFISPASSKAKQAFRKTWLQDPQFKSWLSESSDPYSAECIVCSKMLTANKHNLKSHASSLLHITSMQQKAKDISLPSPAHATASNESETDSSSTSSFISPAPKKPKKQAFRKAWLQDPQFKSWLSESSDPYSAECIVCSKMLTACKYNLKSHASSLLHTTNMQQKARDTSLPSPAHATASSESEAGQKGWRQAFCKSWLVEPQFKSWLQEAASPYKGRCAACHMNISAQKTKLQSHAESQNHTINMNHRKEQLHKNRNFAESVKEFELKMCLDIAEHNRSFASFKHYTKLLQSGMPNVSLAQHMSLNPSKISAIIRNVINKAVILETTEILKGKFFSILVDETTDISDTKIVCFLIRFVHGEKIHTYLLDLIGIKECTAENLHKCLINSLNKYNVPVSNIVGLSVDNASVMVGVNNSLFSRLSENNKEICLFPCICHSMHLAARHACDKLPLRLDKFLKNIYSYFSRSPKRQSVLEDTQAFMKYPKLKMIQPSSTRWLSLLQCVERTLQEWLPLFSVFAEAASGGCAVATKIFDDFQCPYTKAYLQFLNHILPRFTVLNKYFQDSKVLIHCLLPACYKELSMLGADFIKEEYVACGNIHKIDVHNEANLKPLEAIYHGSHFVASIAEIRNSNDVDNEKLVEFYTNIQKFYQTAFDNIVQRVPFDEPFLNSLQFLNPLLALDIFKNDNHQLDAALNKFTSKFDSGIVKDEWKKIPTYFIYEERQKLKALSIPCFWNEIRKSKNEVEEYMFPNISKLADLCLSLPHSNAEVERYFSTITDIKTKRRNRLTPQTIAALTRVKLDLKNKNANCFNYEITDSMMNLFNEDIYKVESIPKELTGILLPIETDLPSESENETDESGTASSDD